MTVAPAPIHPAPQRLALLVAALIGLVAGGLAVALLYQHDVFTSSGSGTVRGSGIAAVQPRHVPAFTGVELAGGNNVTIHVGGQQSVVVHADDNLLGSVTTEVRDGRLVVGNKPGSFSAKSPMYVDVRVPSLAALRLTGSGVVVAEGIHRASLAIALDGSGVIRATGSASRLDVSLGGSGDAQLAQLVAERVHAVVSGSGRIVVTATEALDASVPGSGVIMYGGNPAQVSTNVTGSGEVVRG